MSFELLPTARAYPRSQSNSKRNLQGLGPPRCTWILCRRALCLLTALLLGIFLFGWKTIAPGSASPTSDATPSTLLGSQQQAQVSLTTDSFAGALIPAIQHFVSVISLLRNALAISAPPRNVALSVRWIPTSLTYVVLCQSWNHRAPGADTFPSPYPNRECVPDVTPLHFAPCVAALQQGLTAFGEELLYPDFKLREPLWSGQRGSFDRERWLETVRGISERGVYTKEGGWIAYRGQHGQNLVFANARVRNDVAFDSWSASACMGDSSTISILPLAPSYAGAGAFDTLPTGAIGNPKNDYSYLLVASSPDAWSFQHFLDRSTHIVRQGAHLLLDSPDRAADTRRAVLTGRKGSARVQEMWSFLGFEEGLGQHVHSRKEITADRVVFSCRTPLVHPWLSLGTLEAFGFDHAAVPLEERKMVSPCANSSTRSRRVHSLKIEERYAQDCLLHALERKDTQLWPQGPQ